MRGGRETDAQHLPRQQLCRRSEVFCLVDAPDAEAAAALHTEAHGLLADHLYPVVEGG